LGLSPEIIAYARELMAKGTQDIEMLLADLVSEKRVVENLRNGLEKEKEASEGLRNYWQNEIQRLQQQEQDMLREERDKLAQETAQLQGEVRRIISELKKAKSQENIERAEKALAAMREQLKSMSSKLKAGRSDVTAEQVEVSKIGVGDKVWLTDVSMWGTVLSIREEDGQIDVQVGHTRLRMNLDDAEKLKPPVGKRLPEPPRVKRKLSTRIPSLELNLRGKRADEVGPELDRYLNDAYLASLSQVRIIHGFGTGTVRQIVRDMLASHPLVKSFRPGERGEGGDGVTMVEL